MYKVSMSKKFRNFRKQFVQQKRKRRHLKLTRRFSGEVVTSCLTARRLRLKSQTMRPFFMEFACLSQCLHGCSSFPLQPKTCTIGYFSTQVILTISLSIQRWVPGRCRRQISLYKCMTTDSQIAACMLHVANRQHPVLFKFGLLNHLTPLHVSVSFCF